MYASCKCLNVTIKTKGELVEVDIGDLELSPIELSNPFFNNALKTTNQLDSIMKEQSGLVEVQNIGAWDIHRCYNCNIYTHAERREYGAKTVLINANIVMTDDEVKKLQASPYYSPVFRIIIDLGNTNDLNVLEPPSKFSVSQLSSILRLALGGLEQQLEEAIQQRSQLVDQRIREFIKAQYQSLEDFRERAHNEHSYLARLISNEQKFVNGSSNLDTSLVNSEMVQSNKPNSTIDSVDAAARLPSRNTPLRQQPSLKPVKGDHTLNGNIKNGMQSKEASSYDDETLFELEGMDDPSPPNNHVLASDQDSEDDSGNEEAYISRTQKGSNINLAKSLPVNVPAFHTYNRRILQDDDDDEQISRDPMDPHNIQASIKALAKSVHGDTVFGDLPRPRFSTQI